jgi:hypothetical protein
MKKTIGSFALFALLAVGVMPAFAHHSFAMFDMSKSVTLEGKIKQFDWTNPHTFVWVNVVNGKGETETWGIEGQSPNFLGRRGWSKNTVKPGDKVSVVISPLKDGRTGGMFRSMTLPTGKMITQMGLQ